MYLECRCCDISERKWDELMKGARKCNYKRLVKLIKENLPGLYKELALDYPNPYADMCKQTKTHYILVSSMIEHFIRK